MCRKRSRQCEGDEENQRADDSRQEMRERAHGGAFLNQIIGQNSGNNTASASQLIVQILTCYDTVCVILAHTQCTYIKQYRENTLHATLISSIIAKSDIPDVQEINKIERGKIFIEVNSAAAANRLVKNSVFIKHNFHAFIPAFKVLRTIIQNPQQIDIDTLRNHLESNCQGQKSWICKD